MRELIAEAKVDAGAEGEMTVWMPVELEPLRMIVCGRIGIAGDDHGHDPLALLEPHALELHIGAHEARLGHLDGRHEAQEFLHGKPTPAPIRREPVASRGFPEQFED
jgi:hypothetical protein